MAITAVDIAQVAVGAASAQVVGANPTRKFLLIQNPTANPIRVGFTSPVTTTSGVRLAQGERLVLDGLDGKLCPTQAIFGIREGGADGAITGYEVSKT